MSMIDGRVVELMQRAIDGEATEEETARLQAHADVDESVRNAWEEVEAAVRALENATLVEPEPAWPAAVKERLRSRPSSSPAHVRGGGISRGRASRFASAARERLTPRTWLVFAAGTSFG